MNEYSFADFLDSEIDQRKMSASEFARFVGVSPSTITTAIDRTKPPVAPGLDVVLKLSKATGRDLRSLLAVAFPDVVEFADPDAADMLRAQQINELPEAEQIILTNFLKGRPKKS